MIQIVLVKKLLLDPVTISQNKTKFLSQDPKILAKSQAFDSVAKSLSSDGVGCFVT